jgi:hypothetical protein
MTAKSIGIRNIYMRVTIDGRRRYECIGFIDRRGKITLYDGLPNPGWWE